MKKLLSASVIALALAACSDRPGPTAVESVRTDATVVSYEEILFTTTPPDTAYVGQIYEVAVESYGTGYRIGTETPDMCTVTDANYGAGFLRSTATVTFVAAGTCTIYATTGYTDTDGYRITQTIQVVEPLGSPNAPVIPGQPPVTPGQPPMGRPF